MNVIVREEQKNAPESVEPVAIVGLSCRFPKDADSPEKFWQLLMERRTTVSEIPAERWKAYASGSPKVAEALSSATRRASFLSDIEGFDAEFFGMSAREAEYVDPQQRIVLELSWEALESAGIPPSGLKGSDVGIYVAANSFDFGHRLMSNLAEIQPWTMNGSMLFGIANRVSYALDLRGPSMVVDTACAGSLTVLHLACQALWSNEIPLAIVGGVNIMSNPGMMLALDAAGATAKDGRSKAFDRGANGYGRGEGAGLVVLKRLSDARRDKDHVLAIIRGGGVFQDGRTAGMMAPNPEAQESMLRTIYARFGISPGSVAYVEAHGTGTQAGDQAEISALSRVFGAARDEPCLIGSAKPNVGHLEAGAGVVGLIKAVLAIKNGVIPPSVHSELNDQIDWKAANLRVVSTPTAWPQSLNPRRVGISCFGVGGVISHTIIEEAPADPTEERYGPSSAHTDVERPTLFPLSARSQASLMANARQLATWIEEHPEIGRSSIGHTMSNRRDHLSKRAAIIASSREQLISGLIAVANGDESANAVVGDVSGDAQKGAVWVFSGHGAQWEGMAKELLERSTVFAETIDALGPTFQRELGYTAREAILESDWSTVERIQALTFAVQVALARVWQSLGLHPGAVIGHSVGEVAAAVVSGALDVNDAALFACRRAAIYQRLAGKGAMAIARVPFEEAQRKLHGNDHVVAAIAASPSATVISGDTNALKSVIADWKKERLVVKRVATIDAAFHSPQIDCLLGDIRDAAAHLATQRPSIPLYTTTLTDPRSSEDRGAEFWALNSRGAVLLVGAVTAALQDGFTAFLEVSTAPIVAPSIRETIDDVAGDDITVLATLAPNKPEMDALLTSLGKLFTAGCPVDWSTLHPAGDVVPLPTQSWQHRNFWPVAIVTSNVKGFGHSPKSHTLLGQAEHVRSSPPLTVWRTQLERSTRPYPGSHPLFGVEIVPAAALLYTLMKAGEEDGQLAGLVDVALRTPVPVDDPLEIQIVRQGEVVSISTRRDDIDGDDPWLWTTHTVARFQDSQAPGRWDASFDESALRCDENWSWDRVEELYKRRGIGGYGFPWRMLRLHRGANAIQASFSSHSDAQYQRSWAEILDAALTICPLLLPDDELLRMPSHIGRVSISGAPPERYSVRAVRTADGASGDDCLLTVEIIDESNQLIGGMEGVLFGVLDGAQGITGRVTNIVFGEEWRPLPCEATGDSIIGSVVFVGEDKDCPKAVTTALQEENIPFRFAGSPNTIQPEAGTTVVVLGSPVREGEAVEEAAERNAWSLIETAQRIHSDDFRSVGVSLLCFTQGVRSGQCEGGLAQAPLWGISRIVAGERSDSWAGLYDFAPEEMSPDDGRSVLARMSNANSEDVISFKDGAFWALRLVPALPAQCGSDKARAKRHDGCRADASYLITGGLGALGLEAARYLASRGARRIVLAGRRGLPSRSEWADVSDVRTHSVINQILEIEDGGVTIVPVSVDIADGEQLEKTLKDLAVTLPPIRGIVHAAGIFEGGVIGEIERSSLSRAFAAKVRGGALLHRLFPAGTLDFFVQFSSSGQLARLTGQVTYAAANSFLDGLAKLRNSSGASDTMSIAWMAWRGIGMSRSIDATMIEARGQGLDAIDSTAALKAWRYCEELGLTYAAVFTPVLEAGSDGLPLLSELVPASAAETVVDDSQPAIPSVNRFEWLVADIRHLVSVELKADESNLEVKRPLIDMGVDSLMAVSLRVRLRKRYGLDFPPTLLWNSPSVHAIAKLVDSKLASDPTLKAA